MTYLTAFLLGLIQGVAEFLPISSSGHLAIAQNLLGMSAAGSVPEFFDVLLHLGTLVAVFAAYWHEICDMVVELFRGIGDLVHRTTPTPVPPARRLILLLIVGTLPLFAVLPVRKAVQGLSDNMFFVGGALIFTGLLLFVCDGVRKGRKTERSATWLDALLVGVGVATSVETAALLSKKALMRPLGSHNENERAAYMEKLLEDGINSIGLGPQGMGGKYSVMGVHIENTARHPSAIGVAVNVGCWSHRRGHIIFDKDLNYTIDTHSGVTL